MSAVLGTDAELIEKICNETQGIVSIANYNCPGPVSYTHLRKNVVLERVRKNPLPSHIKLP